MMRPVRIIAGEFRGRTLLGPDGDVTRPITDRAKQSLFDVLSPRIDGARVYDCFSGTGSLGLECLSRGAAHATFFDADRSAVLRLKRNIDALGVRDRATVVAGDLFKWFDATVPAARADLIFLDPPYRFLREKPDDLQRWARRAAEAHVASGAVVVFRHDAADALALPPLRAVDRREYGAMVIELLG